MRRRKRPSPRAGSRLTVPGRGGDEPAGQRDPPAREPRAAPARGQPRAQRQLHGRRGAGPAWATSGPGRWRAGERERPVGAGRAGAISRGAPPGGWTVTETGLGAGRRDRAGELHRLAVHARAGASRVTVGGGAWAAAAPPRRAPRGSWPRRAPKWSPVPVHGANPAMRRVGGSHALLSDDRPRRVPICLGGNVFGGPPTRRSPSRSSTPTAAGGNFIDTANSYLVEQAARTIIGADGRPRQPRRARGRDEGRRRQGRGAQPARRRSSARRGLPRAPADRPDRPLLRALRRRGAPLEARCGPSTRSRRARCARSGVELLARRDAALSSSREGLRPPRAAALQPRRARVRGTLLPVATPGTSRCCRTTGSPGVLTGKYRGKVDSGAEAARLPRRGGKAVLEALDEVAAARVAAVRCLAGAHPR